eukprot:12423795-Karenia_brevis.AAC.2
MPSERLPELLRVFEIAVPRAMGGLLVMGAACQGECESALGPRQALLAPATKRLNNASLFSSKIGQFCEGSLDPCSMHVAWCMTQKSLREALAYDIRTVPVDLLAPLLEQHAVLMRETVQSILGKHITDE